MFQSLFGSLLNYRYGNENVSLTHLSWICITSILTTIYSLKNCSVYGGSCRIYSPKSFGFFQKELKELNLTSAVQYVNVRALFLRVPDGENPKCFLEFFENFRIFMYMYVLNDSWLIDLNFHWDLTWVSFHCLLINLFWRDFCKGFVLELSLF